MGILGWIILGGLAGWIASLITKTDERQGLLGNIIVGIVGGLLGGFLASIFGIDGITGFNFWSFVIALVGAIVVIWLWQALRGNRDRSEA